VLETGVTKPVLPEAFCIPDGTYEMRVCYGRVENNNNNNNLG